MQKIRIEGTRFMEGDKEIRFRGFDLGNWLLIESHMAGLAHVDWKMKQVFADVLGAEMADAFFQSYCNNYMTEADYDHMQELGVNFVRLPFTYRMLEDGKNPGQWKQDGFDKLHAIVDACAARHIYVLLDMHALPGGQAIDWNSDNAVSEALYYQEASYQQRTIALWEEIARQFKDHPAVMGYDPIGEPVCPDPTMPWDNDLLNDMYRPLQAAIRKIDSQSIFVLEGNQWSRDNKGLALDLFDDPQTTYQTHLYPDRDYPSHELQGWPCTGPDGTVYDKEWLRQNYLATADVERIKRPVIAAEFGVAAQHPNLESTLLCLHDLLEIFEEENHSWAFWAYKDIGAYSLVHMNADTPWAKLLLNEEMEKKRTQLSALCEPLYGQPEDAQSLLFKETLAIFPDADHEFVRHRIREAQRSLELVMLRDIAERIKQLPDEEICALPESFHFNNCTPHAETLACLKPFFLS